MSENGVTITDTVTTDPKRRISVTFERKVGYDNYGNATARAWIEGEIPWDADVMAAAVACGDLFNATAAAVFDQLGIEYEMDDNQVLREKKQPEVTLTVVDQVRREFGATDENDSPQGIPGIRVMNPKDQQGPLPYWLVAECERLGITAVWDQRKTATGNQPKFKEAVARGSQGHGKDGQPKGFWEPKS